MTPDRRKVLIDFVHDLQAARMRRVRLYSAIGLVLCGAVAAILASVWLDGATGSEDVIVPAAIGGGLAVVCALGLVYAIVELRGIASGLPAALAADPPRIDRVEEITLYSAARVPFPALAFHVSNGAVHTLLMSAETRAEFVAWLRR